MANNEREIVILRRVYQKLDSLPLSFGIPQYSSGISETEVLNRFDIFYKDTMREMRLTSIDQIEEDSYDELQFENRVIYHALCSYRLSASAFFKFSTATDGKSIDKTNVAKMLSEIIRDYDDQFKRYRGNNSSGIWKMTI